MGRKIHEMYRLFGASMGRRCDECDHFLTFEYHGKRYFKCELYGVSNGEGTDWRKGWTACGLINCIPADYDRWVPVSRRERHALKDKLPIDGQIDMEAEQDG